MASVIYNRLRPAFDRQASSVRDVHEVHSIGTRSRMIYSELGLAFEPRIDGRKEAGSTLLKKRHGR